MFTFFKVILIDFFISINNFVFIYLYLHFECNMAINALNGFSFHSY